VRVLPAHARAAGPLPAENPQRWYRLEVAKRRLFYTLAKLGLVATTAHEGSSDGLSFEFLEDLPGQPVMTGHSQGVITLNVAEATMPSACAGG
jgi:hypothetical protein